MCRFDKDIIQKYIDNTIDPLEYIFLKEHLKVCEECRDELDYLTAVDSSLMNIFGEEVFTDEAAALSSKMIEECLSQIDSKRKAFQGISEAAGRTLQITRDALRFVDYLPGAKWTGKMAKKAGSAAGRRAKIYVNKKVESLIPGQS